MSEISSRTRNTIVALGLIQGILLLVAHELIDRGVWSAPRDIMWLMPWYAVAFGVPTALQLMITDPRERRAWWFGLGLAAALALTGVYTAYRVEPSLDTYSYAVTPYIVTVFIGWYVLLPFIQAWFKTGRRNPDYPNLFEFAWNNCITLLIGAIFVGIFWGLLVLWAALFTVIGIEFFNAVFYNKYFAYPVTALVFAFALYLGRSNVSAVVTVRRIILAVFKALLPLLALIVLLFLVALPFMGLKPLWATGKATVLMLWLQILLMIFLNAVYQDGKGEAPYPAWLRTFVRAALVVLPIYTLLCFYSLYLRIDQHGWTTDRFWAVLLTFMVGLHVVGYAVAAVRQRKVWMAGMASVNVGVAAVTVAVAVLVNSPIVDPRTISVASQVGRLLDGKIVPAEFDYKYLRFDLGRAGNAALARLKEIGDHPQASVIQRGAQLALNRTKPWGPDEEQMRTPVQAAAHFSTYPRGEPLSDSFVQYVMANDAPWQIKNCLNAGQRCAILAVDMNADGRKDYALFPITSRYERYASVFTQVQEKWRLAGTLDLGKPLDAPSLAQLEEQLAKGQYAVVENPWRNLTLGKQTQQFRAE